MAERNNRVVLAGGSGFLGRSLSQHLLERGYEVVVLSRSPTPALPGVRYVQWDARNPGPWNSELEGVRAVVNLAGRSVNCRYTRRNRDEILRSRLDSVSAIAQAIGLCKDKPAVWVQSSTSAIYGDRGDEVLDESSPVGTGFSPGIGVQWERAFGEAPAPGVRKVLLRVGFALGPGGGALGTLATLTRLFLGGTVGSGKQWMSWTHLHDLNEMWRWAIERDGMHGLYLAVGPKPVRNLEFMRALRQTLRRPWSPSVPALAVRLASFLLRTEPELALFSRYVVPRRFLGLGFRFQFPDLGPALDDLLRASRATDVLSVPASSRV
jgi:uncharacterized protein (TIGR01777 family)